MRTPLSSERIDPWRLVAENGRWDGTVTFTALPRLTAAVHRAEGVVEVALIAGTDADGVSFLRGTLHAEVDLLCQRCLASLRWPLAVPVQLGLVRSEAEASRLPDPYEPLLVTGPWLMLADVVEDELLLALPQVARHADLADCVAHGHQPPDLGQIPADSPPPWAALLQDWKRSH